MIHRLEPHIGYDDSRAPSPARDMVNNAAAEHFLTSKRSVSGKKPEVGPVELGIISSAEAAALVTQ